MSTEITKTIVRRIFEEGFNQNKPDVWDELIAPGYVNHSLPAPVPGSQGFKIIAGMFTAAFPDLHTTLEDVVAEGDRVATRGTFTGTHQGEFNGIPATGKAVKVSYIDIWRVDVERGQAVENWVQIDMVGLLQQLGALPTPQTA
jgi:predicted ester cyclase